MAEDNKKDKTRKDKKEGNKEKPEDKKTTNPFEDKTKKTSGDSKELKNKENKKETEEDKKEGNKEQEPEDKKTINPDYDKILRNFLILIGGVIFLIILIYFLMGMSKTFDYRGVDFNEHREKDLIFYHTEFPKYDSQGEKTEKYNTYLRKHPVKETGKIEFEGDFDFKRNLVINFSENLDQELGCEGEKKGDQVIAIANIVNFFGKAGTKVIKDPNATCDTQGRYIFVNIKTGAEETRIKETSEDCYDIYIKDCEILEGTERFILEALVELKNKKE